MGPEVTGQDFVHQRDTYTGDKNSSEFKIIDAKANY